MLAQLDAPTTSIPGPFEQFYNDVDYATRVKLYDIENRLKVLEGYNQSPYTNHLLNSHMVNYVSASPQVAGEFRIVHDKFKIVDHKLAEITKLIEPQEEDESEFTISVIFPPYLLPYLFLSLTFITSPGFKAMHSNPPAKEIVSTSVFSVSFTHWAYLNA